jgi:succinylglutamate desuccinylase
MKSKILFITATHGNEEFSVPVLQELEKKYPKAKFNYDWIIGNIRALEQKVRFIDTDMNRIAPGNPNSSLYEERRAFEIVEFSKDYDCVIDIHGSNSNCGICTIISNPTKENIQLAKKIGLKNNVIWYSKGSNKKGPINQHVYPPSLELECGPKNETKIHSELFKILEKLITDSVVNNKQEFYSVYGKEEKLKVSADFIKVNFNHEEYYPFLSNNSYSNISHYKMTKNSAFKQ